MFQLKGNWIKHTRNAAQLFILRLGCMCVCRNPDIVNRELITIPNLKDEPL